MEWLHQIFVTTGCLQAQCAGCPFKTDIKFNLHSVMQQPWSRQTALNSQASPTPEGNPSGILFRFATLLLSCRLIRLQTFKAEASPL